MRLFHPLLVIYCLWFANLTFNPWDEERSIHFWRIILNSINMFPDLIKIH